MTGNDGHTEPVRGALGATILGPRNVPIEAENPTSMAAPLTDSGTIPNLKYPYAQAHNRVLAGGWAREITTRELPVAEDMAGVNMRLKPGAFRAMHSDGCEFLLVFDDGAFSENETFLITDWFAHTPRDVLARNFGVPERAFDAIPLDFEHSRYLFPGQVPPAIELDRVQGPAGASPISYSHRSSRGRRSRPPAAACGSWTPRPSPSRRRSPRRSWRSTRAACGSCTGTRTAASGSITSGAPAR